MPCAGTMGSLGPWDVLGLWDALGSWNVLGPWDASILTDQLEKLLPDSFLPTGLIPFWEHSSHWHLADQKV